MRDQTVVVTGANRGIGLELARQLKAAGAHVIATARDPQAALELQELKVRVEPLEVIDSGSVKAFAERLGDLTVDLLINNAGVGAAGPGIAEIDLDASMHVLDVNSLGPLRVSQALLPHLQRGDTRKIAHITSQLGSLANNDQGGYYAYRASKAALNMLHRCLAHELAGHAFTCLALHPGWVQTDMGGERAPLGVEESARGLLQVIVGAQRADNGRFLDHQGEELPW